MKSLRLGAGQFAQLSNGRAMTEKGRKGEREEEGKKRESEKVILCLTLESQDDSMGGEGGMR